MAMHRLPHLRATVFRFVLFLSVIAGHDLVAQVNAVSFSQSSAAIAESDLATRSNPAGAVTSSSVATATGALATQPKANETIVASQVLLIVDQGCEACDQLLVELESEFAPMRLAGWRIGRGVAMHVRIIDKAEAVSLLKLSRKEANAMRVPNVLARSGDTVVRYFKDGCSTPLDRWTFDWLITGKERRPAPPPMMEVTVESSGNYPLRGSHWSVEGDWHPSREKVLLHLRGPNHAHQLRDEWTLDHWSREELRSLHDNLHELEEFGRTNVYSSPINLTQTQATVSNQ